MHLKIRSFMAKLMTNRLGLVALFLSLTISPLRAEAISVVFFDNYDAWTFAVNEPIAGACMSSQNCFPTSFGSTSGLGYPGQGIGGGLGLSDQDWFRFANNPAVTALGFNGFGLNEDPLSLSITGISGLSNYFSSSTGFIGFVGLTAEPWTIGRITVAPFTDNELTRMYFNASAAPGFGSTIEVPEPSTFLHLILALSFLTFIVRFHKMASCSSP
jgi:hypothetical protein